MIKKLYLFIAVCFFISNYGYSQCGQPICNPNTGILSNDNAADIAYDNMGSAFHSTLIKEPNGGWKVWGEYMGEDGSSNVLSPLSFNATNYSALTGTIYKMAIGSDYSLNVQLIVLTSDGLFVLGEEGAVVSDFLTSSNSFQKLTVNGKLDGLPLGVAPDNVKMLFAANRTLIITTCEGAVYVLSQSANVRGNGGVGNASQWYRVMVNSTTPLTNVVVARGVSTVGYALKSDGTLWTWGNSTYLGDASLPTNRPFATQMTLPAGIPGIKMIQATNNNPILSDVTNVSYYILGTDKKVYALGSNAYGQLGDRTTVDRTVWVNAKKPDNSLITDAAWISANEHDENFTALAVIRNNGVVYTAGCNSYYMIGRTAGGGNTTVTGDVNYLDVPNGITNTDFITFAETGGHTCALIKQCYSRYGYVGHRIRGSIGDGTDLMGTISAYDFNSPPEIAVCGAQFLQPIITTNNPICPGQNAVFSIVATPGDILTYSINNGPSQTLTIQASGNSQIVIPNVVSNQQVYFSQIYSINTVCEYNLAITSEVNVEVPVFTQVPSICQGANLSPLPTVSNNGITGVWSPAINNLQTTTYTFTPTSGSCLVPTTMTIQVVEPNTVPLFPVINPICQGDTITLPTLSENGITGSWSPTFNNFATTTYTFTPTISCANTTQVTVVVNPIVTPIFNPINPICEGGIFPDLPTNSLNNIVGTWSPAPNNTQTMVYTFTPTSNLCTNTATLTVVVTPKITPHFLAINPLCYGVADFNLPTTSIEGITGTWSPPFNNTQSATYTFTPNSTECAFNTTTSIVILDDFDFDYSVFCVGNSFYVQLQSDDVMLSETPINWSYNGNFFSSAVLLNVSDFIQMNSFNGVVPLTFLVTVTDSNGCEKTQSVVVDNPFCSIPNVITPNEDDYNSTFDLTLLSPKRLEIYNRWGVKVYEKDNYLKEWYGQNNSGGWLPDGVYYYIIELPSGDSKTSWIQIIR